MFSSLRSDSMALSTCVWVFLEVVFTLMEACESQQQLHGDCLHQEHCVRCGTRISSVVHVTMLTPRLLYDKCKGSSRSCGERMYQMHLSGNISTLLWPMFHIHTSEPELGLCLVQSYLGMLLDA